MYRGELRAIVHRPPVAPCRIAPAKGAKLPSLNASVTAVDGLATRDEPMLARARARIRETLGLALNTAQRVRRALAEESLVAVIEHSWSDDYGVGLQGWAFSKDGSIDDRHTSVPVRPCHSPSQVEMSPQQPPERPRERFPAPSQDRQPDRRRHWVVSDTRHHAGSVLGYVNQILERSQLLRKECGQVTSRRPTTLIPTNFITPRGLVLRVQLCLGYAGQSGHPARLGDRNPDRGMGSGPHRDRRRRR